MYIGARSHGIEVNITIVYKNMLSQSHLDFAKTTQQTLYFSQTECDKTLYAIAKTNEYAWSC